MPLGVTLRRQIIISTPSTLYFSKCISQNVFLKMYFSRKEGEPSQDNISLNFSNPLHPLIALDHLSLYSVQAPKTFSLHGRPTQIKAEFES